MGSTPSSALCGSVSDEPSVSSKYLMQNSAASSVITHTNGHASIAFRAREPTVEIASPAMMASASSIEGTSSSSSSRKKSRNALPME